VLVLPPPKRLAIPEIKPPKPAMLLNPPLKALAIPPDAVFVSKLAHSLPDCEVLGRLLEGDPKLMPVAAVFAPIADVLVSPELGGLMVFSVLLCA
jgi:hypothetical protein